MISGQKSGTERIVSQLSFQGSFARCDNSDENRTRSQTSTLQNNNNPQDTQYNSKKVKEWVLMEKQLLETLLEPEVTAEMVLKRALAD